jgi:uncharacterized protein YkwD
VFRTPAQGLGFLLGFWLALWLSPFGSNIVRAEPELAQLETRLHAAVNAERERRNLVPLLRLDALDNVARAHSADMAERGYLAHASPEGKMPLDRIESGADPGYTLAAENLGITDRSQPNREILEGWLDSAVHRRNLLAPPFNATGVGISRARDGSLIYTQVYVTYPR